MNRLPELFRVYLLSKKPLSKITAKNYVSDIKKFVRWFEESFGKTFQAKDLTLDVITLFEKNRKAPRSMERYLSSLRKFAAFLSEEGYIDDNPFDQIINNQQSIINKSDPWSLKDFKDYLYVFGASNLTIKNYLVDINAFTKWLEDNLKTYLNISNPNISNINPGLIEDYKQRLILVLKVSPKTVNRKLSSIRKYLEFSASQGHLSQIQSRFDRDKIQNLSLRAQGEGLNLEDIEEQANSQQPTATGQSYSGVPPVRLLQKLLIPYVLFEDFIAQRIAQLIKHKKLSRKALLSESFLSEIKNIPAHIPFYKKLIHHAKYTRPNWYKTYHTYTFTHYFHLAILIIYASIIGFILYTNLFAEPREKSALAGPIAPKRVLSFQGRLTDASDNPITAATDIRFGIYESETATGSALLWQEVHSAVTPDSDGIFSVLLGTKDSIPSSVFRDHDLIWLGITIGKTPELTPRQRVAAVAYAANSESLQGMLPITDSAASTANVVLALDSSGNLTMGGTAAPTFAATGGQFKLSGKTLLLATEASSNGDVDIAPDGIGKIDLHKPIVNTTATGNLVGGSVEINDRFAVLATESAVAAFVINNNTTGGDIFTASSSGTTRMRLDNAGQLILATQGNTGGLLIGSDTTLFRSAADTLRTGDSLTVDLDLAVDGGDLTTTAATFNLVNAATTVNLGSTAVARTINLGTGTGDDTINIGTGGTGTDTINIATSISAINPTLTMGNTSTGFTLDIDSATSAFNVITVTTNSVTTLSALALSATGITTGKGIDLTMGTALTTGSGINVSGASYAPAAGAQGDLVNLALTSAAANTSGNSIVTGVNIASTLNTSGATGTKEINPINIAAPTITACTGGNCTWSGVEVNTLTTGALATLTSNGVLITATGIGAGTLNGINISNITAGAGTETAISVGSGWDDALNINSGQTILETTGVVTLGLDNTATTNGLCHSGTNVDAATDTSRDVVACSAAPNDIAEWYETVPGVEEGDLISTSSETFTYQETQTDPFTGEILPNKIARTISKLQKSSQAYQNNLVGVVSTSPFQVFGADVRDQGQNPKAVALVGRVPAKVSTENGTIKIGDAITSSSVPGVGMKATKSEQIVGAALESFDSDGIGKIIVFVNPAWYDPDIYLTDSGQLSIKSNPGADPLFTENSYTLNKKEADGTETVVDRIGAFAKVVAANISAGLLNARKVETDSLLATNSAFLTSNIQDLISNNATLSGTLSADKIKASSIELLNSNLNFATLDQELKSINEKMAILAGLGFFNSQPLSTDSGILTAVDNLMVSGSTTLSEAAVLNNLTIGNNLTINGNSINTIGQDLEIQPLKQGNISFLGGAVLIDTEGNLKVEGNAEFAKDVKVGGVLSATTVKIPKGQMIDISAAESIASASAGVSHITVGQAQRKINSEYAKTDSVIIVTPESQAGGQPLYIRQKNNGSFIVGADSTLTQDLEFNFIIINQ